MSDQQNVQQSAEQEQASESHFYNSTDTSSGTFASPPPFQLNVQSTAASPLQRSVDADALASDLWEVYQGDGDRLALQESLQALQNFQFQMVERAFNNTYGDQVGIEAASPMIYVLRQVWGADSDVLFTFLQSDASIHESQNGMGVHEDWLRGEQVEDQDFRELCDLRLSPTGAEGRTTFYSRDYINIDFILPSGWDGINPPMRNIMFREVGGAGRSWGSFDRDLMLGGSGNSFHNFPLLDLLHGDYSDHTGLDGSTWEVVALMDFGGNQEDLMPFTETFYIEDLEAIGQEAQGENEMMEYDEFRAGVRATEIQSFQQGVTQDQSLPDDALSIQSDWPNPGRLGVLQPGTNPAQLGIYSVQGASHTTDFNWFAVLNSEEQQEDVFVLDPVTGEEAARLGLMYGQWGYRMIKTGNHSAFALITRPGRFTIIAEELGIDNQPTGNLIRYTQLVHSEDEAQAADMYEEYKNDVDANAALVNPEDRALVNAVHVESGTSATRNLNMYIGRHHEEPDTLVLLDFTPGADPMDYQATDSEPLTAVYNLFHEVFESENRYGEGVITFTVQENDMDIPRLTGTVTTTGSTDNQDTAEALGTLGNVLKVAGFASSLVPIPFFQISGAVLSTLGGGLSGISAYYSLQDNLRSENVSTFDVTVDLLGMAGGVLDVSSGIMQGASGAINHSSEFLLHGRRMVAISAIGVDSANYFLVGASDLNTMVQQVGNAQTQGEQIDIVVTWLWNLSMQSALYGISVYGNVSEIRDVNAELDGTSGSNAGEIDGEQANGGENGQGNQGGEQADPDNQNGQGDAAPVNVDAPAFDTVDELIESLPNGQRQRAQRFLSYYEIEDVPTMSAIAETITGTDLNKIRMFSESNLNAFFDGAPLGSQPRAVFDGLNKLSGEAQLTDMLAMAEVEGNMFGLRSLLMSDKISSGTELQTILAHEGVDNLNQVWYVLQNDAVPSGARLLEMLELDSINHILDIDPALDLAPSTAGASPEYETFADNLVGEFNTSSGLPSAVRRVDNPVLLAEVRGWQGSGSYPGRDDWVTVTMRAGTQVQRGGPGESSFFSLADTSMSQVEYWQSLQVDPHDIFGYRPFVEIHQLPSDMEVAIARTAANPQLGGGGAWQVYISDYDALIGVQTTGQGNQVRLRQTALDEVLDDPLVDEIVNSGLVSQSQIESIYNSRSGQIQHPATFADVLTHPKVNSSDELVAIFNTGKVETDFAMQTLLNHPKVGNSTELLDLFQEPLVPNGFTLRELLNYDYIVDGNHLLQQLRWAGPGTTLDDLENIFEQYSTSP